MNVINKHKSPEPKEGFGGLGVGRWPWDTPGRTGRTRGTQAQLKLWAWGSFSPEFHLWHPQAADICSSSSKLSYFR